MSFDRPTVPAPEHRVTRWGSDALAELLSRLDLPFIALTPGSSYRGLHDSLVNYGDNAAPTMIVCIHEEHAVAVAHGYAKVSGRPLAVALHANVGLMHAVMAVYNAWCDRVPMVIIGATGPVDAAERRPWIDWIHTAADQGALVRSYVKFDDQPASIPAALEALVRADAVTRSYPQAPVYVNLDASIQEAELTAPPPMPELRRFAPPSPPWPGGPAFESALELMTSARRPVILVGRVGRGEDDWRRRIELAEGLGAAVLCDLKAGAGFPSAHPLNLGSPGTFLAPGAAAAMRESDCIISLDWIDLGGTVGQAATDGALDAQIVSVSGDHVLHNGWSKDHFGLPAVDAHVAAQPDAFVAEALHRLSERAPRAGWRSERTPAPAPQATTTEGGSAVLTVRDLAVALRGALDGHDSCLVRLPLGWNGEDLWVDHPLDYLGQDGGGGVGSGPGMAVGAALALRDSDRMALAVLGDGDFVMGSSALWTAAHLELPLLVIVANNRSFFNDEVHQERVARVRDRPVENRWLGQHMREPDIDLTAIAAGLGFVGLGPAHDRGELGRALAEAVATVAEGGRVVLDVRVTQSDYPGGPPPTRSRSMAAAGS
jgi:thiamine pyrophosphate-dependent acetolactate synthase large subunit-like protein